MEPSTQKTGRLTLRDLTALTVLLCLFFTFMLGNRPLSVPDEGRYVEIPREMVVTGDYLTPRLNGIKYFEKPVLFYWLEAFSIRVFGLNEFTLRLWPALFALFGCLGVGAAGARLFGRKAGIMSAIVLASSLLYFGMGRGIILDMPVSTFLTLAFLSFLVGIRETGMKRRLYLWGFYACAALAVLTKGLIGMFIPAMVIGVWILLLGEWRLLKTLHLVSGAAVFLLIAVPWHVLVTLANPEFFRFYFIQEHFLRYLTKMHGRFQPLWFFVPIILLGLFPWSAFLVQAVRHNLPISWKDRHEHRDAFFLLLWALLVFLFFSASSSKLVPYILPVLPPLALLIGRYLADARDRFDFPGVKVGYAVASVLSALMGAALLALPSFLPIPDGYDIGLFRHLIAAALIAGPAVAWAVAQFRGFKQAFLTLAASSALVLLLVNAAAPRLDLKSVKPLAVALKPLLTSGDEVASYATYYQDLPVYLERRITIVDWNGEIDFGTKVEDTSAWVTTGAVFWKRWQGSARMFAVMYKEDYETLRQGRPDLPLHIVSRDRRNVVVCNREVRS